MKGRIGIVPMALLGVGCGHLRPWTPSVSVAFWTEDVPGARSYAMPSSSDLAQRWQLPAASPWSRYHKATLIAAVDPMGSHALLPDISRLEIVAEAEAVGAHVGAVGLPPNTMWIVDLRGAASAAFVASMSQNAKEPIAPVVTFNNWPAENGLVPADETLAGLVSSYPRLPPPDAHAMFDAHPVFLLDSWRLAYRFDEPDDDTYDNRYMLMPSDLPDAAFLRERAITRVIYLVEDLDDAEVEEDDLHASFREWQSAGIGVHIVDLAFLKHVPPPAGGMYPADWTAQLAPRGVWVRDRWTLCDDPGFYWRARGGFGLVWGLPVIYPGYTGSYGHGRAGGGSRGSGGSGG